MKTLDFVSSLTLDSDLVRAVLFCICIILESRFLSISPLPRGGHSGPRHGLWSTEQETSGNTSAFPPEQPTAIRAHETAP